VRLFEGHGFLAKPDTSRSEFLGELKKFGFFSGVEFECKDTNQSIFFVREVGMLERLSKMFRSVLSKDIYQASGDALIALSQKNMVLAGVLGRSVFDANKKIVSARELNDRLRLGEKKLKSSEGSVLAVPSEEKLIVTDAVSSDFRGVHQVDLTNALTQENFRDVCDTALTVARKKSSEDVLIVNLRLVSDNGEPSDEVINNLLLVIDEHQKSNPTSRLMIATDGDYSLYKRLLNLKVQHDAKKVSQSNTLDLSPMDLLMISPHGDDLVKLDPIDENRLKKFATQFENVSVCITNYPEMIRSDLSIVNSNTLDVRPGHLDEKPAVASRLSSSVYDQGLDAEQGKDSVVGKAFKNEKEAERKKSTLYAARFPAMDLPVKRLIVFEVLRAGLPGKNPKYEYNAEKVRHFYLRELRKEQGRVVIQSPRREYACEGLRRAVEELREKNEGPAEIIITTPSYKDSVFGSFKPPKDSKLTE
jgi:hypothetical protein